MAERICVFGAGAFGTAIATVLARSGVPVGLYCNTREQAAEIRAHSSNGRYFPGFRLPDGISPTDDFRDALSADIHFLAFPARTMSTYVESVDDRATLTVVNLVKGFHERHLTFANLFERELPNIRYVALKGPTFARQLFLGEPSGLTCGSRDPASIAAIRELFRDTSVDVDGCGAPDAVDAISAIKNVYAIAIGMAASLGFAENTIYMLLSRIVREIRSAFGKLGLEDAVFYNYAGLGDIMLTSMCDTSRNRTFGTMLGRGVPIDFERSGFLAEGVRSIGILRREMDGVDLPILQTINNVLSGRAAPLSLLQSLHSK
jgi:glycerol-3-phosphate dehydrogenase (NAD(P)+)